MKCVKSLACLAVAAMTTIGFVDSAEAMSFRVTRGIAGPKGETNQGAFSEFSRTKGVTTVDFNSGAPTTGFARYSFVGNGSSSVRKDMWAPVGANNEKNDSNYLAVFSGKNVVIDLAKHLNYFGINWGAAHAGNTYSFFNGDRLVRTFTTADIDRAGGFAIYSEKHPGSGQGARDGKQGNGYVHFYSTSAAEIFNRIVISQSGGGGFETDNHSFHVGKGAFNFDKELKDVPEPGIALGLMALGGVLLAKRNGQKQQEA
ncbi:MAG: PEP-CTERM sorting domain-containing protein [Synechococcales cyanobacterium M58_A2018_015]|nr:PEP-CTERM sorting domain-containing protein [Synechococcales cyanobacterium M58_A2018_015]